MKRFDPYQYMRSQPHYSYEALIEGVIRPTVYLSNIKQHFIDMYDDTRNVFSLLNKAGNKYKIAFFLKQNPEYGDRIFIEGFFDTDSENIEIYCNLVVMREFVLNRESYVSLIYSTGFSQIIGHEIIHRLQKAKRNMDKFRYGEINVDDINQYLSDPDEIMSFAWQIVEWYRIENLSDESTRKLIQNASGEERAKTPLYWYYKTFKNSRQVLNELYKYIYMYLDTK
jgi:hypothetical protein